ncbi:hypothetical protein [Streptomyces asiaticus]|uniref:hypothetical protein n=1 Tax=Streptomyces asiaticus TaxID=114695 RepID=UPI003F680308
MKEERCDHCELIIGQGCGCASNASGVTAHPTVAAVRQQWQSFPPGAILISPTQYAHLPGCGHLTESLVKAPRWGWIPDPPAGLWDRLGAGYPAIATAGNTDRRAVRRCESCEADLSVT